MNQIKILSAIFMGLQVCCNTPPPKLQPVEKSPRTSVNPGKSTTTAYFQDEQVQRAMYFLKSSGCGFVEKMAKDPASEAVWHKQYYCKEKRIYLRLFVFKNQKAAMAYAESFMKRIGDHEEQTRGQSRLELIHKWGVNGPLLFIVRGDDESAVSAVLSHFAGEE